MLLSRSAEKAGGLDKLTQKGFVDYSLATTFEHAFGGTPLNCAGAPAPYSAACSPFTNLTQWDGAKYITKRANVNGVYLVKGTKIDTGSGS